MPASQGFYADKNMRYELPDNASNLSVVSAADADAVITIPAELNKRHVIAYGFSWSYDGDPTGGRIVIREGGTPGYDIDVTVSGPGFIPFYRRFAKNVEVQIVLYAAGAGVVGKLNLLGYYPEPA